MDPAAVVASLVANGQSGHDITKLLLFVSQEMHLFFAHIHSSSQHFQETGEVPHSIFTAKAIKEAGREARKAEKEAKKAEKKEKQKRPPSVFNLFVKYKMEELKASGFKPNPEIKTRNPLFSEATAAWSKLSEEEKKAMGEKYAKQIEAAVAEIEAANHSGSQQPAPAAAAAAPAAPAPAAPVAAAPSPAPSPSKKDKKEKKRKHKEAAAGEAAAPATEEAGTAKKKKKHHKKDKEHKHHKHSSD